MGHLKKDVMGLSKSWILASRPVVQMASSVNFIVPHGEIWFAAKAH